MRRLGQAFELLLVFIGLPILFALTEPMPRLLAISLAGLAYLAVLLNDKTFDKHRFGFNGFKHWNTLILRFSVFALLLTPLMLLFAPEAYLPEHMRQGTMWLHLLVGYSVFSVIPQAVIYRVYFFHRFRDLLNNDEALILLNALLFSFLHIVYHNWLALVLTLVGGIVFAFTYLHSKSFAVTAIEHALYGETLFLIGLGSFFTP